MRKFMLFSINFLFTALIHAQSVTFMAARTQAGSDITAMPNNCRYNATRNIYIDNTGTIHIFLFEDGNLLLAGYPTTATEKNKYQVHLYISAANDDMYSLEYTGSYTPVLNIQNSGVNALAKTASIKVLDFAIIGPFTNTLQLTVKRLPSGANTYNTLTSATIQVSKTIHVSIGSGLLYSTLKNPSNIRKIPIPGSTDSSLLADDIGGRGILSLFATYYPWGRNSLLMPEWNFKDRFGVVVGTSIAAGASNFKDFFVGGSYDFSAGGSIVLGLHYGKRQKIAGVKYQDFKFGESSYSGNLDELKYTSWDLGIFFGIQVDSRIFSQLFK